MRFLVYYWKYSDYRRRNNIRKIFRGGAVNRNDIQQVIADVDAMHEPRPADYARAGRTVITWGFNTGEDVRQTATVLFTNALQGVQEPIFFTDDDINTAFILHQIAEVGLMTTPELIAQVDRAHDVDVATRVENAREGAGSKIEAVNNFLDKSVVYTSQGENVHDSSVNSDLRETYGLILEDTSPIPLAAAVNEANAQIKELEKGKRERARTTLQMIARNEMCSTFNAREADIFATVWARCDHVANKNNKPLMHEAIVAALVDATEVKSGGLKPVCINGRIARVLNSLTLLDYDPRVGNVMTYEAYRNQILQETKEIINLTTESFANGTDDQQAAIAAYETGEDEGADELLSELRVRIDENLANYTKKIGMRELDKLRNECHIYAAV